MQAVVDIKFNELLKIVKNLPETELIKLKAAIDKKTMPENDRSVFEILLLNGPTFSEKQLDVISKTRQVINQWRTK
ncbi:MAG: hypothetical protein JWR50_1368 [Mucilaginibacter sp.]|nr:hypothetical protein [Mucilaginibacter sp.]